MLYQLILLLITLVFVVRAHAAGTIGLPFGPGQTWTVCRGYNGPKEHSLAPVFDLVIDPNSVGQNGCIYNPAVSSAGREVLAPGDGYLYRHGRNTDGVCVDLDNGGAVDLLHLTDRRENGRVTKGQVIGKVAGPTSSNNKIPHIHIQLRKDGDNNDCGESLVSFTYENGGRFQHHSDLPYGGAYNQHRGAKLSNPAASAWHPPGTLIRAVDDYRVYLLWKGKRYWIYNEATFNANGFRWEDVIVVSSQERDCYADGGIISNETLNLPYWNGYKMGTLVRKAATDPVYVVGEDKKLQHVNVTEAQFISFGYMASMIHDVSSVENIGTSLTIGHFARCEKTNQTLNINLTVTDDPPPPSPSPPPVTGKSPGATCTGNADCASQYCTPIPNGQKYCLHKEKSCSFPDSDGVNIGTIKWFEGEEYVCSLGNIYLPTPIDNGKECSLHPCKSGFCSPTPWGEKYCIAKDASCAKPNTPGIKANEEYYHTVTGKTYVCATGDLLVDKTQLSPSLVSPGTVPTGYPCDPAYPQGCVSGFCEIGPDGHYCISSTSHCAKPGVEGARWDDWYSYQGKTYDCMFPSGIIARDANRNVPDGMLCLDWRDCASGYCYEGPRDRFYCVNAKKNCVQPGKEGVMYRDTFWYDHILYECVSPGETVKIGP